MSRKSPPQSLYGGPNRQPTIEELRRWGPKTRREQFLETLKESQEQANAFENLRMQRGAEYAERIRAVVALLELKMPAIDRLGQGESERVCDAMLWAFDLGMWRALATSDAQFAHSVRQHESMLKGKGFVRSKRPSNNDIQEAIQETSTKGEAAKKLGVSDRTLRRWINE